MVDIVRQENVVNYEMLEKAFSRQNRCYGAGATDGGIGTMAANQKITLGMRI